MILRHLGVFLLIPLLAACQSLPETRPGAVSHVVFVWFKDAVTAEQRAEVEQHTLELASIPGLRAIHMGKAVPSPRPFVDDSFDLGVVMDFDSVDAMHAYLTHPRHQEFQQRYVKGRVERILIYDIQSGQQ